MFIYIFFFLYSLSAFIINNKNYIYLTFTITFILFIIVWGLRWDIGNDYQGLIILNQTNMTESVSRLREPFFYIVSAIDIYFDFSGFFVIFIYNFFTYIILYFMFKNKNKNSKKYIIFFLITSGFIFWANDQTRQALAFVIYLYYLNLFYKSKNLYWKKSIKLILLGGILSSSVHFSFFPIMLITLLVYILNRFISIYFYIILPILALSIHYIISLESIFSFINYLITFLPIDVVDRFLFDPRFYSSGELHSRGVSLLIYTIIFYLLLYTKKNNFTIVDKFLISLTSFYLSSYIIFFDFFILKRLFSIGLYLYILFLPSNNIFYKNNKFLIINLSLIFLLSLSFFSYVSTGGGRHGGIPYMSLLDYY